MDPDEETDLALDIITENGLKVKYRNRLKKRWSRSGRHISREIRRAGTRMIFSGSIRCWRERSGVKNKMSFADLLEVCTELLRTEKKAETEAWRPAWIIVDEVQGQQSASA